MAQINLLPVELSPTGLALKISKLFRKLSFIGLGLFVAMLIVLVGVYVFYSVSVRDVSARGEVLKSSIKSLESTETRIVLINDRIKKIKEALGEDLISPQLAQVQDLSSSLTSGATLSQTQISGQKNELQFMVTNPPEISGLLAKLREIKYYGRLVLDSLSFDPQSGFQFSVVGFMK